MGVPSVTKSSSVATEHFYQGSVSNAAVEVFSGRGNLYGFLIEENSGTDCYIQFFDAASAASVTVGTTAPTFTIKLPANGIFGKDVNDSPLHFFAEGCVVAVTRTRTGAGDGSEDVTANAWFWNH